MGLSLTDTLALVSNGYKVSEIAQVSAIVSSDQENGQTIIDLAKKLKFSDFTQAIDIFKGSDNTHQKTSEDEQTDNDSDDRSEKEKEDSSADDQGKEDDVDYKKLYEEEKSLRTQLQQKKQLENNASADDKKSDYEIALQAAVDVLN